MPNEKLDRSGFHEFNVHQGDRVSVWNYFGPGRWNLSIETPDGGQLRLYSLSDEQLSELALQIAAALGKPPELNRKHLEQCYELLSRMLGKTNDAGPPQRQLDVDALSAGEW